MEQIPDIIKELAAKEGCNHVEFVGNIDNQDVYCISELDDDGLFVPCGLPTLLFWNGSTYKTITSEESLTLLRRLQ